MHQSKQLTSFLFPLLVFLVILVALLCKNQDIGVTWDEPAYIAAAKSYTLWFDQAFDYPKIAFNEKILNMRWQVNSEHPPLDKVWSGAVWSLTKGLTDDLTAHRLGNMLLAAALAAILFIWVRDTFGNLAGFVAVGALFSMPRFFFHAHLAALDVPAAFSGFVTTFVFWKLLNRRGWAWGLLLGLVWGLALATKINAVFIPVILGVWTLLFRREWRGVLRLVVMGLSAIPVFIAVWPWLYFDTFEHLRNYLDFITTDHWQIGQFYLGKFFMPPPWHFPFVMLWAVVPLGITVMYLLGIARSVKYRSDKGIGVLFLPSALVPVLALSTGKSVVYDNERLMMAAFPFLAALAGAGFGWLIEGLRKMVLPAKPRLFKTGVVLLLLLGFVPQLVSMVRLYPHYLSYYAESVGGLKGANKLGLETTYWCETYQLALPIINKDAKPGDLIWADPWSHDVLVYYQVSGKLRDDVEVIAAGDTMSILGDDAGLVRYHPISSADWFLFQHRETALGPVGFKNSLLTFLSKQHKVFEYTYESIPVFTLYKK